VKGRTRRAAAHPAFERLKGDFLPDAPRVAIYCGDGASHSWIWFTDLLERLELFDVAFITHGDILARALDEFDILLVGGGDTYAMAGSLGREGARLIERFVTEGGLYHGSCAGAYLVLSGVDLEPFTPFSLVEGNMLNVMPDPPEPLCLAHKYLAPYGDEWVFHPVYGEVELVRGPAAEGFSAFGEAGALGAPLFGGPVLTIEDEQCILADYAGSTARAAFPWPREDADRLISGEQAVALRRLGDGTVLASGPHLEHPLFPRANELMAEAFAQHWAGRPRGTSQSRTQTPRTPAGSAPRGADGSLLEIKRQVSNARIVGFGLEKMPVTWQIGVKVWEPEKIRMFLDYTWDRLPYLDRAVGSGAPVPGGALEILAVGFSEVTGLAKTLKLKAESGQDSQAEALSLLTRLKELTASFLSLYFRLRLEERLGYDRPTLRD